MQIRELMEATLIQTTAWGNVKVKARRKRVNQKNICVAWDRAGSTPNNGGVAPKSEVMNLGVSVSTFHHVSSRSGHGVFSS